ncbi:FixH family protein [Aestuariicoccus sp. MJ-SS9]|uniref:FixH family protein n=1 Tax=Aestuariicoccus sp. MJ-SS9 TaxID=3079855 RepID=UPI00290F0FDB|nr:FixH family protein [Aestuariicoccus sp. MJ-SS9]MDU8913305.1 FixH family protein [Aestuariicoccus sp. MJ-SS9]
MFRLIVAVLICIAPPALAERILAEATCSPTHTELQFRCEIALNEGGAPVDGAAFTVKPDMPSMPMAHNIPPVPAEPTDTPGVYSAQLELQMLGDWTLTLDLTKPRRDRIVVSHKFDDAVPNH